MALALLPHKNPSSIGTTVSVMCYAICAIRLAEQTIDDNSWLPVPTLLVRVQCCGSAGRPATSDRPAARSRWLCWR